MLKTLQAEFMKSRHNRLFILSAVLSVGVPLLIALKDLLSKSHSIYDIGVAQWLLSTQDIVLTIMITVLSGLLVTFSFQKEYVQRTIILQITCPVSRAEFLAGKLGFWAIWHMFLTVLVYFATAVGAFVLYPGEVTAAMLMQRGVWFILHGLFILFSILPLAAAAVLQKSVFYPSMLLCLGFTLTASCSNVLPGILPVTLPWSAARVLGSMELDGNYFLIALSSVLMCAAVGFATSMACFKRQKL